MTELFIEKSKLIHWDKYDYSKVDYKNSGTKVIIICQQHGEFQQTPNNHLHGGYGCCKCGGTSKSNTTDFVEKSIKIHGNLYDYSKVNYINSITKTTIICQEHGEFQQTPKLHLKGAGCGKCAGTAKNTESEFLDKCNEKFGDLYDYSKMNYKNFNSIITICCKIHGDISIIPKSHLKGIGCSKCGNVLNGNKRKTPLDEFIKKCREKHGDKYDYSKVDYIDANTKIIIICKEHGEFQQKPNHHLNRGSCCPKCTGHYTLTTEEFIEKSKLVHGDLYDYSKVDYKNSNKEVSIICKIHGEFSQKPVSHYWNKAGCPKCANKNITTEDFIEKSKLVHGDIYDYSNVIYNLSSEKVIINCKEHGEFIQRANDHLNGSGCPNCCPINYSKKQILWLHFLSKYYNIDIRHAENDGEYLIPKTKYKADGFCKENNTIYEFHGDFWHGNPNIYKDDDINTITKCTYKELYEKTLKKEGILKDLGYNLVVIWENDWKKINKCVKILQQKFRKYNY